MSISLARPIPIFSALFAALARDIGRDINVVFYLLTIALTALVLAVKTWGVVALTMAALPMVPVMFGFFIWISLP